MLDPEDCKEVDCSIGSDTAGAWDDVEGGLCAYWAIELKFESNDCNWLVTSSVTRDTSCSITGEVKTVGWSVAGAAGGCWACTGNKVAARDPGCAAKDSCTREGCWVENDKLPLAWVSGVSGGKGRELKERNAWHRCFHWSLPPPHSMIRYHPIKITSGHWVVSFTCQKARLK